ncbi:MAG: nucleotidyltransferase family protein [Erysipelotrichaceae bacterium]|nr:nucleotidyltransferase family protein [Erysipelotrichaceae bacterium]
MKCIILAAGYATRLYPLTENFPKPLLEVAGRTILDRLIDDIGESIDEFILVSNHKFYEQFSDWSSNRNITVIDDGSIRNEERLGAVRDLEIAIRESEIREDCMVMAGDNLLDFSLKGFIDFFKEKNHSCVMCHEENRIEALRKTAVITVDEDHRILSYEEKPEEPKGNLAVPPFYIYKAEDITRVSQALNEGCSYDAPGSFAVWLSGRSDMYAYPMPGRRYDIGDLKSYKNVCELFKEG